MNKTRKRYNAQFKSKVALEAIKEQKTLAELSDEFQIHPNQISQWKKQLLENANIIFSNNSDKIQKKQHQIEAQLYQQIGQLKVENDWLKKKLEFSVKNNDNSSLIKARRKLVFAGSVRY